MYFCLPYYTHMMFFHNFFLSELCTQAPKTKPVFVWSHGCGPTDWSEDGTVQWPKLVNSPSLSQREAVISVTLSLPLVSALWPWSTASYIYSSDPEEGQHLSNDNRYILLLLYEKKRSEVLSNQQYSFCYIFFYLMHLSPWTGIDGAITLRTEVPLAPP